MTKEEMKDIIETFLEDNGITINGYATYDGEDRYTGTDYFFECEGIEISIDEF